MNANLSEKHPLHLDLSVEVGPWPNEDVVQGWFDRAISAATVHIDLNLASGELSVMLTDDAAMQTINLEHRGQDKPTNVLSFPGLEPETLSQLPGDRPFLLGDLVFAHETISRESTRGGLTFEDHMLHLIVHGFLHLLGYDHEEDGDAQRMESLEVAILRDLNISDPYAAE